MENPPTDYKSHLLLLATYKLLENFSGPVQKTSLKTFLLESISHSNSVRFAERLKKLADFLQIEPPGKNILHLLGCSILGKMLKKKV